MRLAESVLTRSAAMLSAVLPMSICVSAGQSSRPKWRGLLPSNKTPLFVALLFGSTASSGLAQGDYELPAALPPAAACAAGTCNTGPSLGSAKSVYLATGELHRKWTDLTFPGRGIEFAWTRTYRSKAGDTANMGVGWDHSYNLTYQVVSNGLLISDGSGRIDLLQEQTDGSFLSDDLGRSAEFQDNGTLVLRFPDLLTWTYGPNADGTGGRIQAIADRNGNNLQFAYDGEDCLRNIQDTLGRNIEIQYDQAGLLSTVTDPSGRQVSYTYRAVSAPVPSGEIVRKGLGDTGPGESEFNQLLVASTTPAITGTPMGNDFPNGLTTFYGYDAEASLAEHRSNLISVTDPTGETTEVYSYSGTQDEASPDFDRVTSIFDPNVSGELQINLEPAQESAFMALGTTVITNDGVGNVVEFDFDTKNRLIAQREYTGRANPNLPTTKTSNRPTGKLRPSDPTFFNTTWTWNYLSLVTLQAHPNGNQTRRVYEVDLNPSAGPLSRGNLREEWREPGSHAPVGDQPFLVEKWEYSATFGGCCGGNFVTKYTDQDGFVTDFVYDANGNRIQKISQADGAQTDHVYDSSGRLIKTIHPADGDGDRREDVFTYTTTGGGAGLLKDSIVDFGGLALTTTLLYDANGHRSEVVDPNGNSTEVVFNAQGVMVQERSPLLTKPNGSQYRIISDVIYDGALRPIQILSDNLDEAGNVLVPARNSHTFTYDGAGNMTRFSIDMGTGQFTNQDFVYNAIGLPTLIRKGEAVAGNQPWNEVAQEWDERSLPFRIVEAPASPLKSTRQFDYDGNRNRIRVSTGLESGARVTNVVMDAYNRRVTETDPIGGVTTWNLNGRSAVVHEKMVGSPQDPLASSTPERLSEKWMTLDGRGRMTEKKVAHFAADQSSIGDGFSTTAWTFAQNSSRLTETRDDGGLVQFAFDSADRRNSSTFPAGNTEFHIFDGNGNSILMVETETNELTASTESFVTSQVFDPRNFLVSVTDSAGQTNGFGYDSVGNMVLEVDGRGNETRHSFDAVKRPTSTQQLMTSDGTGSGNHTSTIAINRTWDLSGRMLAITDGEGNATSFAYDELDRMSVRRKADGSVDQIGQGATWALGSGQPNLSSFTTGYNAHGDQEAVTFATGSLVSTIYDRLGRQIQRSIGAGAGVSNQTTVEHFFYDGVSRLVYTADDDTVVQQAFDSLGSQTLDNIDNLANTAQYDGMGQRVNLVTISGRSVQRTFDNAGRLRNVSSGAANLADYQYVGPRRIARRDYGNGTWTLDDYDSDRRITRTRSQRMAGGNPVTFDGQVYAWDATDNKVAWADMLGNGPAWNLFYDSANQLAASQDFFTGAVTFLSLDLAGNRLQQIGGAGAGNYVMDASLPAPADKQVNQYTSTPAGARAYNSTGATTSLVNAGRSLNLSYDYRDRLVSAVDAAGGYSETYEYDVHGRRVLKRVVEGSITTDTLYTYMGQRIVSEGVIVNGTPTRISEYAHGVQIDEMICMWTNGTPSWFHSDDLYNITCLSDAAGNVIERYSYGLFGEPSIVDPSGASLTESIVGNTAMFQSLRYDSGTGLYQNRIRYYDPVAGRFITADPKGAFFDEMALGNAQVRAGNNPWSYTDPSGYQSRQPGDLEPNTEGVGLVMTAAGVAVGVVGAFVAAPFVAALGVSIGIHGLFFAAVGYFGNLTWCEVKVTASGEGGPAVGEEFCYICPNEDNTCPKEVTLIEWEGVAMEVKFQKVNGVCTDDCGENVLDIYPVTSKNSSTGGETNQQVNDVQTGEGR